MLAQLRKQLQAPAGINPTQICHPIRRFIYGKELANTPPHIDRNVRLEVVVCLPTSRFGRIAASFPSKVNETAARKAKFLPSTTINADKIATSWVGMLVFWHLVDR